MTKADMGHLRESRRGIDARTERQREKDLKVTSWHKTQKNQISAPLIIDPTQWSLTSELKEANVGNTVESLNETLSNINSLLAGLNNGEGSMGKLLKDETLYQNLEGATKEMEALLKDIKLHPKRYFRILSKKEIPYQESETNW